jgi:hypothetical protein
LSLALSDFRAATRENLPEQGQAYLGTGNTPKIYLESSESNASRPCVSNTRPLVAWIAVDMHLNDSPMTTIGGEFGGREKIADIYNKRGRQTSH